MTSGVVIIDTGCANVASLKFAIERLGYQPEVSVNATQISEASSVFLPGVGTAKAVMRSLSKNNLIDVIKNLSQPLLGICLGMQIFSPYSNEGDGEPIECLDLFDGRLDDVKLIDTKQFPVPHMGWNTIDKITDNSLFERVGSQERFYFVHSYMIPVSDVTTAVCDHGKKFSASIKYKNFYGVQFHPERSGKVGAIVLNNFLNMSGEVAK